MIVASVAGSEGDNDLITTYLMQELQATHRGEVGDDGLIADDVHRAAQSGRI